MKRLATYILQRWQYPSSRISFGSRVAGCAVEGPLVVGERSVVAGSRIERFVRVDHHSYVAESTIGSYSFVGPYSILCRTAIGRFCSIGPFTLSGTGNHPVEFVSTSPVFFSTRGQCGLTFTDRDRFKETGTITIGHDVWLGARVFIRDGVSIGTGAVVGAGAVVARDVAPYAIVGGVPARVLRHRFSADVIASLLELAWWSWDEADLRRAVPLMASNDTAGLFRWAAGRGSHRTRNGQGSST